MTAAPQCCNKPTVKIRAEVERTRHHATKYTYYRCPTCRRSQVVSEPSQPMYDPQDLDTDSIF